MIQPLQAKKESTALKNGLILVTKVKKKITASQMLALI
jgi:hypothetical protein